MNAHKKIIETILQWGPPKNLAGKGLTYLEIDYGESNRYLAQIVFNKNSILGIFQEAIEYSENIWGGRVLDLNLSNLGYYRFFTEDGKKIKGNWKEWQNERVEIESQVEKYGKELLVVKNIDNDKWYVITREGKVVDANQFYENGII
jgi:hypothetical protein